MNWKDAIGILIISIPIMILIYIDLNQNELERRNGNFNYFNSNNDINLPRTKTQMRAVSFQQFHPRQTKSIIEGDCILTITEREGGTKLYLIYNQDGVLIAMDFGTEANDKTKSLLKWIKEEAPRPNPFFK